MVPKARPFAARRLLGYFGAVLAVVGIGLMVKPFGVSLGSQPTSDFIGLSGGDPMPNALLLSRAVKSGTHIGSAKAPSLSCGVPVRMVFRDAGSDGGGWYNYTPNGGVASASGSAAPAFCKPAAQRRVELAVLAVLLGFVLILASRWITPAVLAREPEPGPR